MFYDLIIPPVKLTSTEALELHLQKRIGKELFLHLTEMLMLIFQQETAHKRTSSAWLPEANVADRVKRNDEEQHAHQAKNEKTEVVSHQPTAERALLMHPQESDGDSMKRRNGEQQRRTRSRSPKRIGDCRGRERNKDQEER